MKKNLLIPLLLVASYGFSQTSYIYEPNEKFPYGQPNPNAPRQVSDFEPMIGKSECESVTRKQDGTWNEPLEMFWTFKYIMNGYGVQDEALKADGGHSGSIRQYIGDSAQWYVHYYSNKTPSTTLGVWVGNKENDKIVLRKTQKAPNGMEGFYRLTFSDFKEDGYKWIGEWVSKDETIIYPTWKIDCTKLQN